uniref:Uncharacterized protein n=1 Tax=Anguilla anguilla TaxID=7936 RepID=A0A0E9US90_ANGAN
MYSAASLSISPFFSSVLLSNSRMRVKFLCSSQGRFSILSK